MVAQASDIDGTKKGLLPLMKWKRKIPDEEKCAQDKDKAFGDDVDSAVENRVCWSDHMGKKIQFICLLF